MGNLRMLRRWSAVLINERYCGGRCARNLIEALARLEYASAAGTVYLTVG